MIPKNKKGYGFMIWIGVLFFLALIAFLFFHAKFLSKTEKAEYVGQEGQKLLQAAAKAESTTRFLMGAGRLALRQALFEAGLEGSMSPETCGLFRGFVRWGNRSSLCLPASPERGIEILTAKNIDQITKNVPAYPFLFRNYLVEMKGKDVMFFAAIPLVFPLDNDPSKLLKEPPYAEETMKHIIQKYNGLIRDASRKADVPEGLLAGIVAATSGGDNTFVNERGCAGLAALCEEQAARKSNIIKRLTPCDCKGKACKIAAKCTPQNDDRFSPEKSLEAAAEILRDAKNRYFWKPEWRKNYLSLIAADFLGAREAIEQAKKEGLISQKSTWLEISAAITPNKFRSLEASEAEDVSQMIRTLVPLIFSYKKIYESLEGVDAKHERKEVNGYYERDPSFTIYEENNLNDYDAIKKWVREANRECETDVECWLRKAGSTFPNTKEVLIESGGKKLGAGISEDEAEKDWQRYCETEPERALSLVAGAMQECIDSLGNDCLCETETGEFRERYVVSAAKGSGKHSYKFAIQEPEIYRNEEEHVLKGATWVPSLIEVKGKKIGMVFEQQLTANKVRSGLLKIYKNNSKLWFVKEEGSKIKLVDGREIENKGKCRPSKNIRVCVVEKSREVLAYMPATKVTSTYNPVIRFSFYILGPPPPKIENVRAEDKKMGEGSLLLAWKKPGVRDIKAYAVYYSKKDFIYIKDDIDALRKEAQKGSGITRIVVPVSELEKKDGSIDLDRWGKDSECRRVEKDARCYYDVYEYDAKKKARTSKAIYSINLEPGKGQEWEDGTITYVLGGLEDGEDYYISVTAIEEEGRESEEFDVVGPAATIDDYPPRPCLWSQNALIKENNELYFVCETDDSADIDMIKVRYEIVTATGTGVAESEVERKYMGIIAKAGAEEIKFRVPRAMGQAGIVDVAGVLLNTQQKGALGEQVALDDGQGDANRLDMGVVKANHPKTYREFLASIS